MQEIWKPVVGLEDAYEVSSIGRVRSIDKVITASHGVRRRYKGQIIKPHLQKYEPQGYTRPVVGFSHKGRRTVHLVHRLVAEAFCHKPDGCNVVNHVDADPMNNHYTNLEWTTHQGNSDHARALGLYDENQCRGSKKYFAKLSESDVREIIRRLCRQEQQKDIAKDYGIAHPIISNINRGVAWKHVRVDGCGEPPYFIRKTSENLRRAN